MSTSENTMQGLQICTQSQTPADSALQCAPPAALAAAKPRPQRKRPSGTDHARREAEADLVTAFFDVLLEVRPDLAEIRHEGEQVVRHRLKGLRGTITDRPDRDTLARRVLEMFNGRNAREVARRLRVSRGTVYRLLKQAGRD